MRSPEQTLEVALRYITIRNCELIVVTVTSAGTVRTTRHVSDPVGVEGPERTPSGAIPMPPITIDAEVVS